VYKTRKTEIVNMNEISDTTRECSAPTSSYVSANSHFTAPNEESSPADREREAPPRGAFYEVHRFVSLEKAKLMALLIVLGCACNHALLRYKYGNDNYKCSVAHCTYHHDTLRSVRCCCCCLLQTTLSCQVTNTSYNFQSKYINSVVNVVASGTQILSKICQHTCMTVNLEHSE